MDLTHTSCTGSKEHCYRLKSRTADVKSTSKTIGGVIMIIQNVFDLEDGLRSLVDKELPIPVAFKIQKNHAKVVDELKIANELRKKLINKYKESETDEDRKSTRLNSSHVAISYAVFCLKKI